MGRGRVLAPESKAALTPARSLPSFQGKDLFSPKLHRSTFTCQRNTKPVSWQRQAKLHFVSVGAKPK